jgi:hypothetical protein
VLFLQKRCIEIIQKTCGKCCTTQITWKQNSCGFFKVRLLYIFLYNTCGSYTISIRVAYKNNIAIYFYVKHTKNDYFPSPPKFEMISSYHMLICAAHVVCLCDCLCPGWNQPFTKVQKLVSKKRHKVPYPKVRFGTLVLN